QVRATQFALLLAAVGVFFFGRRCSFERANRTLRAIAEALRVQAFWSLVGMEEHVERHYGRIHRGTVGVVRNALRGIGALSRVQSSPSGSPEGDRIVAAKRHWIGDQQLWLRAKIEQYRRWAWLSGRGFWVGVVLGLLLGTGGAVQVFGDGRSPAVWFFGMGVALAAGVLAREFDKYWAFEAQFHQYESLLAILDSCSHQLDKVAWTRESTCDVETARQALRETGMETLAENVSWFNVRLHRPLELNPK
ncbi:MAG: hypothetical protein L0170_19120, partial [Acidobacteria bacterium]|nr:hypothetical protein [Acidobacteriota bacterium]